MERTQLIFFGAEPSNPDKVRKKSLIWMRRLGLRWNIIRVTQKVTRGFGEGLFIG